jgi:ankyrin repeat protein
VKDIFIYTPLYGRVSPFYFLNQLPLFPFMSQTEIDDFVASVCNGKLTPEGVTKAVVTRGIPVNGQDCYGNTALGWAVFYELRELIVALLAAGASANVKDDRFCKTSVWFAAAARTADTLQLLLDGDGSVNEPRKDGQTPLIALVKKNQGDAAARLDVLLARPELNLDATYKGKTAEQWAVEKGHSQLAGAIAAEVRCVSHDRVFTCASSTMCGTFVLICSG